jgi:hypothetical protein
VAYGPRPPLRAVEQVPRIIARHGLAKIEDYMVESTARAMVDPRWALHHPVSAVAFAWRYRQRRGFVTALREI